MTPHPDNVVHPAPASDQSQGAQQCATEARSSMIGGISSGADEKARGKTKLKEKAVKNGLLKQASTPIAAVHAKHLAIQKRSILSNSSATSSLPRKRANTLLDQPLLGSMDLVRWKQTRDEFVKLAIAASPLHWMAKKRSWELKAFTLVINEELSRRLDNGDPSVITYLRDEIVRRVRAVLGAGAEFLYAIEKAPKIFSDQSSRRRWHLHGLMIGPPGFASPGTSNPLRRALRSIKGEADADLMFQTPGKKFEINQRSSAVRWCFYAAKNGLSVQLDPALAGAYDTPPGKPTFISTGLRREAQRWHDGTLAGLTTLELIQTDPGSMYED